LFAEANTLAPMTEGTLAFAASGLGRILFPDIMPRRREARDIMVMRVWKLFWGCMNQCWTKRCRACSQCAARAIVAVNL
jgi:hypothetical protein